MFEASRALGTPPSRHSHPVQQERGQDGVQLPTARPARRGRARVTNYIAFNFPKRLGAATFYIAGMRDASGSPLVGDVTYRLRVPPNVPAKQYWSVTVYDLTTGCFIRESPRVSLDSFDTKAQKNADGSVDVYFGPKPPAGKESNWLYTAPGQPWFTYFRFYVPEKAVFDTNRRNFRQAHFLDLIGSDQALIS